MFISVCVTLREDEKPVGLNTKHGWLSGLCLLFISNIPLPSQNNKHSCGKHGSFSLHDLRHLWKESPGPLSFAPPNKEQHTRRLPPHNFLETRRINNTATATQNTHTRLRGLARSLSHSLTHTQTHSHSHAHTSASYLQIGESKR